QLAFGAAEALRRALARELGPYGIRVLTLQTGGIPESIPPRMEGAEAITEQLVGATMLGRTATLEDVGNVAAFAASDLARSMTATKLNITCGSEVD
ncbi:MAG TPA: SDR family oxidoreductase, partial [Candidatus Dormibacteraeota bacterium]